MTYREFFELNDRQRNKLKEQLPKLKENNKELFDINHYKCRINEIRNDKYCYLSNNTKLKVEEVIYYVEHGMLCLSNPSVLENWKGWQVVNKNSPPPKDKSNKELNISLYPYTVVYYKKFVNDNSFSNREKDSKLQVLKYFYGYEEAEEYLHKIFWKKLCQSYGMSFESIFSAYKGMSFKEITKKYWENLLDRILETEGNYETKSLAGGPNQLVFNSDWHNCYFRGAQFELDEIVEDSAMSGRSVEFYWEVRKNKG